MNKKCPKCEKIKLIKHFHKNNLRKDKLCWSCKLCVNDYRKKYYHENIGKIKIYQKKYNNENKLKIRETHLLTRYNLNLNDYNKMLCEQNYKCFICKKPQSQLKKKLGVDHCHKTGKIRKLLCDKCNVTLGNIKENPKILNNLILYIRKMK